MWSLKVSFGDALQFTLFCCTSLLRGVNSTAESRSAVLPMPEWRKRTIKHLERKLDNSYKIWNTAAYKKEDEKLPI
jgi:hypothetical protein